jgi:flagellar biosynthesis/type III secretory pathway protein FliH
MATIIRKDSPHETTVGRSAQPISFSFTDMRGQADDYLGTVRAEAAKIVQQAHQQAEIVRRQAEAAGRKAAEAAVERILDEKVAKRMQTLLPALEQVVREVNDLKGALLVEWESSATKVSLAIAKQIIGREVTRDPQISLDTIRNALRLAAGATEIKLHVNPGDYTNLGAQLQKVAATLAKLSPSEIVADQSITAGGCRVETKFGEVDLQIETQLRRIEEELS